MSLRSLFLWLPSILFASVLKSQTCPEPTETLLIREHFGSGPNFGPPFDENTDYNYGAIGPGNYQVSNTTGLNGASWHSGPDHTPGDQDGYALIFDARGTPGDFFQYSFEGLCPEGNYRARVWVSNINVLGSCGGNHVNPSLQLFVRDVASGQEYSTVLETFPRTETQWWVPFDLDFPLAAGSSAIELRLYNDGGSGCGNDYAIDDVELYGVPQIIEETHDLCVEGLFTDSEGNVYNSPQTVVDTISATVCSAIIACTELIGNTSNLEPVLIPACRGDTVLFQGNSYVESTRFFDTLSFSPCVEFRQIDIVFGQDTAVSQTVNLCPNDSWTVGNSTYDEPGTYFDTLLSFTGCDSLVETIVTVAPIQISLRIDGRNIPIQEGDRPAEVLITQGDSVSLEVLTQGFNSPIFSWELSESLSCLACPDPWLRAIQSEELFLVISDPNLSCTLNLSIPIRVLPCQAAYVPNAFSPNDDGINDRFFPFLQPCVQELLSFRIYDRWGSLLYDDIDSDNYRDGWDGRANGQPAITGTYLYLVELRLVDGSRISRSGTVNLLP